MCLSVVLELQRDRVVELAQEADHCLQVVLALGADAHRIALDRRLGLGELVADPLGQLLGLLAGQPPLQADVLTDGAAADGIWEVSVRRDSYPVEEPAEVLEVIRTVDPAAETEDIVIYLTDLP